MSQKGQERRRGMRSDVCGITRFNLGKVAMEWQAKVTV